MKNLKNVKILCLLAIFIVLSIICSKLLSVELINMKSGFTFIVTAVTCAVFGTTLSIISAIFVDILANTFFYSAGGFYLPFVITKIVTAIVYSYFFYRKEIKRKNIIMATIINSLLTSLFLNTLWISMLTKTPFFMQLYARVPVIIFNYVTHTVVLLLILPKLVKIVREEILRIDASPIDAPYKDN